MPPLHLYPDYTKILNRNKWWPSKCSLPSDHTNPTTQSKIYDYKSLGSTTSKDPERCWYSQLRKRSVSLLTSRTLVMKEVSWSQFRLGLTRVGSYHCARSGVMSACEIYEMRKSVTETIKPPETPLSGSHQQHVPERERIQLAHIREICNGVMSSSSLAITGWNICKSRHLSANLLRHSFPAMTPVEKAPWTVPGNLSLVASPAQNKLSTGARNRSYKPCGFPTAS